MFKSNIKMVSDKPKTCLKDLLVNLKEEGIKTKLVKKSDLKKVTNYMIDCELEEEDIRVNLTVIPERNDNLLWAYVHACETNEELIQSINNYMQSYSATKQTSC